MFKVGDKVRIKITEDDWDNYLDNHSLDLQGEILQQAEFYNKNYPAPLKIYLVQDTSIYFVTEDNETGALHRDWLTYYEEEEVTSKYYLTEEGFLTCDDNWAPGKLGVF